MVKINLYTEEERSKIWKDRYTRIHKDMSKKTIEEIMLYIEELETECFLLRYERNFYEKEYCRTEKIKEKMHTYKVEMNRYRRKLTRIYKQVYKSSFANYVNGLVNIPAEKAVKIFKNL